MSKPAAASPPGKDCMWREYTNRTVAAVSSKSRWSKWLFKKNILYKTISKVSRAHSDVLYDAIIHN